MRKKRSRVVALVLTLVLVLSLMPTTVFAVNIGKCGDNLTYTLDNGTMTISGTGEMWSLFQWDFLPHMMSLKTLVIESGVTSIGQSAFCMCDVLTSVTIPDTVTSIGGYAFGSCFSLTSVTIPASVTSIGEDAFLLSGSVTIYGYAGSTAETYAKENDIPFVALTASENKCGDNVYWDFSDGVLTIWGRGPMYNYGLGDAPWWWSWQGIKKIIVEDGVTSIGSSAFFQCTLATSITIPESVTSIGTHSFEWCCSMTSFKIPSGVTVIPDYAFLDCYRLASITIPDGVTSIGNSAFSDCVDATSVTIPDSVTTIGRSAFYGLTNLTNITIPASVTSIGERAFGYGIIDYVQGVVPGFTVTGYKGTAAEQYAIDNNFIFRALADGSFTDIFASDYYAKAVTWAVENGITSGTSNTTFSPSAPCTRGQIVTFLWNAAGKPEPTSTKNPFMDVPNGKYYTKAVLWAVENGITAGSNAEGTLFSPDAPCTRAQAVTFQYRAAGEPAVSGSSSFGDVSSSAYYAKAVAWAVSQKITSGTGGNNFSPNATCTRAQIVSFLYRELG